LSEIEREDTGMNTVGKVIAGLAATETVELSKRELFALLDLICREAHIHSRTLFALLVTSETVFSDHPYTAWLKEWLAGDDLRRA
jgi:hypothetical protein